jgi:hypothetical protein
MRVVAQPVWVPKAGNSQAEYEDAVWPIRRLDRRRTHFRAAVADGASDSSFAGIWARLLVRAYGDGRLDGDDRPGDDRPGEGRPGAESLSDALEPLRHSWRSQVGSKSLPWYAEEKLRRGAFATLVGVDIQDQAPRLSATRRWRALALGDSCLAQRLGQDLLACFPLDHSSAFTTTPYLLASDASRNQDLAEYLCRWEGDWEPGDSFYLMTDALAWWFLREHEAGQQPWSQWPEPEPSEQFGAWVQDLRDSGRMRNDDVTLLRLDLR